MTDDALSLRSEAIEASVAPLGAELVRLGCRGRDLLWPGDARFWAGRSPLLFPVVGKVRDGCIRVAGRSYPMPQHGFARTSRFEVVETTARGCRLVLVDDDASRESYPFPFHLALTYAVEGARLTIEAVLTNPGADALPASFGFHPGFLWPIEPSLDKRDYVMRFGENEGLLEAVRLHDGLIAAERVPVPLTDGALALDESLFAPGALIMPALKSRSVRFASPRGRIGLDVAFDGLPQLALWMRPGAGFLCIELWRGFADPTDFTGDFAQKPGLALIPAGGAERYRLTIDVTDER